MGDRPVGAGKTPPTFRVEKAASWRAKMSAREGVWAGWEGRLDLTPL